MTVKALTLYWLICLFLVTAPSGAFPHEAAALKATEASVMSEGILLPLRGLTREKIIVQLHQLLDTCWLNTVTEAQFAEHDDLEKRWEEALDDTHLYVSYSPPIKLGEAAGHIVVSEILFGLTESRHFLTRHNRQITRYLKCDERKSQAIFCLEELQEIVAPAYGEWFCDFFEQQPPRQIEDGQSLTVIMGKWSSGEQSLEVEDHLLDPLRSEEVIFLKESGLTGRVQISGRRTTYEGRPKATAIIVMQTPLAERVQLPQPKGTMVLYVQTADGFTKFPDSAETLDRVIELYPYKEDASRIMYSVEEARGGRSGSLGLSWEAKKP